MKFLSNKKISSKIIILISIALVINIVLMLITFKNINEIRHNADSIYKIRLLSVDYLIEADRDAYQSTLGFSHSLHEEINSNDKKLKKKIKFMTENMGQVLTRFNKFRKLFNDKVKDKDKYYSIFDENFKEWKKLTLKVEEFLKSKNIEEARKIYFGDYNKYFGDMRNAMDKLTEISLAFAKKEYSITQAKANSTFIIGIIFNIVLFIFFILLAIFLHKIIAKPLQEIVVQSKEVADGNLHYEYQMKKIFQNDEIGDLQKSYFKMIGNLRDKLTIIEQIAEGHGDFSIEVDLASEKDLFAKALNKMLDSLNEILGQVNVISKEISKSSIQVATTSQQLSEGASEQASSLEEVSASLNQINSQAKQNSQSSNQAKSLSYEAKEKAQSGQTQMEELLNNMTEINNSSENIKKVIKLIDDIAFQINLLALNANVEAARAGKYGKGFAVVAEEVRNLAVRSADAVKESTQMIEKSIQTINRGNETMNLTAGGLTEIFNLTEKIADIIEEISVASQEQAQGLDQISTAIEQIDSVTQGTSSQAEQTASTAGVLADYAGKLKLMVNQFKLKESKKELSQKENEIPIELINKIKNSIKKELEK